MKQLTKRQAIDLYENGIYEYMSEIGIVKFQLYQDKLCMPFEVFHKAVESVLKRPVFTHEFADANKLRKEFKQLSL